MNRNGKSMESAWEQSRKVQKKKIIVRFFLILSFLFILGILIMNNRDLISGKRAVNEPGHGSESTTLSRVLSEDRGTPIYGQDFNGVKEDTVRKKISEKIIKTPENVKKTDSGNKNEKMGKKASESRIKKNQTKTVPVMEQNSLPEKQTVPSVKTESDEFSVELPPFPCSIENRKDIVISLSLELFYKDSSFRDAILFRRNELKVMVMRVIRKKVLPEMKINVLEKELLKEVNSVFDRQTISKVKIRNIKIEKVSAK